MGLADIYRNKAAELTRKLASTKSLRQSAEIRRERDSYIMLANSEDWLDGKIKETKHERPCLSSSSSSSF